MLNPIEQVASAGDVVLGRSGFRDFYATPPKARKSVR